MFQVGRVTAYQISFDLYQSASQQFLGRVMAALRSDSVAAVTEEAVTVEERPEGNEQASTTESVATRYVCAHTHIHRRLVLCCFVVV